MPRPPDVVRLLRRPRRALVQRRLGDRPLLLGHTPRRRQLVGQLLLRPRLHLLRLHLRVQFKQAKLASNFRPQSGHQRSKLINTRQCSCGASSDCRSTAAMVEQCSVISATGTVNSIVSVSVGSFKISSFEKDGVMDHSRSAELLVCFVVSLCRCRRALNYNWTTANSCMRMNEGSTKNDAIRATFLYAPLHNHGMRFDLPP